MKAIIITKKLSLSKETVTNLSTPEMKAIQGGKDSMIIILGPCQPTGGVEWTDRGC